MRRRAPAEWLRLWWDGSDKKDAKKLACLLRAGGLEGIHIPSPVDPAIPKQRAA